MCKKSPNLVTLPTTYIDILYQWPLLKHILILQFDDNRLQQSFNRYV